MTDLDPIVGDWYKKLGGGLFEVVAMDDGDGTIEVQHYDGTVEEYDLEAWKEMLLLSVEPPEDWAGSLDIEKEDYGVDLDEHHSLHSNPLDQILDS